MPRIKKTACAVLAAGAAVSLSLVAVAQGGGTSASTSDGPNATVSALDQPRGAEDALPQTAASEMEQLGVPGVRPDLSVRALSSSGSSLYLTPAADAVCLSSVDATGGASVNCRDDGAIEAGSAGPTAVLTGCEGPPPPAKPVCQKVWLYGVVPDGVERVAADVASSPTPTAGVTNNVYLLEIPFSLQPTAVRYTDNGQEVRQAVPF